MPSRGWRHILIARTEKSVNSATPPCIQPSYGGFEPERLLRQFSTTGTSLDKIHAPESITIDQSQMLLGPYFRPGSRAKRMNGGENVRPFNSA
jgi:hypothetical protein